MGKQLRAEQAERAERNQVKLYITVPDDDGEGQLRAEGLAAMIVEDVQFPTFVVSTEVDERPNQDLTMDEVPPPTAWKARKPWRPVQLSASLRMRSSTRSTISLPIV